ncbi:MAG: hypothetical protein ACTHMZ_11850, partial [Actinomycetes bacterium]
MISERLRRHLARLAAVVTVLGSLMFWGAGAASATAVVTSTTITDSTPWTGNGSPIAQQCRTGQAYWHFILSKGGPGTYAVSKTSLSVVVNGTTFNVSGYRPGDGTGSIHFKVYFNATAAGSQMIEPGTVANWTYNKKNQSDDGPKPILT